MKMSSVKCFVVACWFFVVVELGVCGEKWSRSGAKCKVFCRRLLVLCGGVVVEDVSVCGFLMGKKGVGGIQDRGTSLGYVVVR